MSGKTVVVLGASYAGLGVAHKLLKASLKTIPDLRVILVSESTHLYWNLAAGRAIVPDAIPDDELARPIAPGFAAYPAGTFELVLGTATGLETASKTVTVALGSDNFPELRYILYDVLVIATGARATDPDMPWKARGDYETVMARLHAIRDRVATASHIVLGGAGATGVETAGDLGYAFAAGRPALEKKQIILLSAGSEILGGDAIAAAAEKELVGLGVIVRKGTKVRQATRLDDGSGKTEVLLDGGEKMVTDLYLHTTGLRPNSDFVEPVLLRDGGYLAVDEFFRVQGADGVFGVGDVVSIPGASFVTTDWHSPQVAKNVELHVTGSPLKAIGHMPAEIFFAATGPKRGAGRIGFAKVPSFVVNLGKGKTLGVERGPKYVNGSRW